MVFNIFLLQTFLNILHLNLCGKYMPTAVWIRVNSAQVRSMQDIKESDSLDTAELDSLDTAESDSLDTAESDSGFDLKWAGCQAESNSAIGKTPQCQTPRCPAHATWRVRISGFKQCATILPKKKH